MTTFDYIIVGAGAAGCVLAHRLSEDPGVSVALLEAGPSDAHPYVHMPRGLPKLMADRRRVWMYTTQPQPTNAMTPDYWFRGRMLGGSSSINGMVYVRGQPADFDALAKLTSDDWSWRYMSRAYQDMENHELGSAVTRGDSGPLRVSLPTCRNELTESVIAAGAALGLRVKADINEPDDAEGVGYLPRTIHRGKRQSAAVAFLRPIERRKNLSILIDTVVDKVSFNGTRATGVETVCAGSRKSFHARREVILCGGCLATPGVLERSGIGDPERLHALKIPLVHANRSVGEHVLEHRTMIMQWQLRADLSQNQALRGWRLLRSVLQYCFTGDGPMSCAAMDVGAWFKSRRGIDRPDAQVLIGPYSRNFERGEIDPYPGICAVTHALRPSSKGSIHITSRDPDVPPSIAANYRTTQEDGEIMVAALRFVRRLAEQAPLRGLIHAEMRPGPDVKTDAEILAAFDKLGGIGYHAVGSCRMGNDADSVVDPELRVRGVEGLRIVDTSILPTIVAGNTNAPTMAIAWRAVEIMRRGSQLSGTP